MVLLFFLTFDGTILTFCSTNITFDCTFVTFGDPFIFFSHLMVPSLHCAVQTSHVTVLLSYLVVPFFFFSHFMVPFSHCTVPTSHVTILLSHSMVPFFFFFFLTFDGTILILCSTNITWWLHFCHIPWFIYFFSYLMVPSLHCAVPTSHVAALSYDKKNFRPCFRFLSLWLCSPLSLSFSIVYASLFNFVSLKFFSSKPSPRTYLDQGLLNETLSKTYKRRNRSLSHERYLASSSMGIVLISQ